MRAIVGDRPLNQRFLKVVLARCGFDELIGATNAAELLDAAAAGADLIVFDPHIIESATPYPVDIVPELARRFPRRQMLVLSPTSAVLERARDNGIAAVRKRSLCSLREIEAAVQQAVSMLPGRADGDELAHAARTVLPRLRPAVHAPAAGVDLTGEGFDMHALMRPRAASAMPTALESIAGA